MTGKERIKKALEHQEADRVPLLEIAIGNKLASKIQVMPCTVAYLQKMYVLM